MAFKKVNQEGLEKTAFENWVQKEFHSLYRETLIIFFHYNQVKKE